MPKPALGGLITSSCMAVSALERYVSEKGRGGSMGHDESMERKCGVVKEV